MEILNLKNSFVMKLKTLYDIEKQLEAALPKMAEAAMDPELKKGFKEHLKETENQSKRLEEIFKMLDSEPQKQEGEAIRGLIADGDRLLSEKDLDDALKDVILAGSGRTVEHYEMACYLCAIEEAEALGMSETAELLEESLKEEQMADEKLAMAIENYLEDLETGSEQENE